MGFKEEIVKLNNRLNSIESQDADEIYADVTATINNFRNQIRLPSDEYSNAASKLAQILLDCYSRSAQSHQRLYYAKQANYFANQAYRTKPFNANLRLCLNAAIALGEEFLSRGYLMAGTYFKAASKFALDLRDKNQFLHCQMQLAQHYWYTASRGKNSCFFNYVKENATKSLPSYSDSCPFPSR